LKINCFYVKTSRMVTFSVNGTFLRRQQRARVFLSQIWPLITLVRTTRLHLILKCFPNPQKSSMLSKTLNTNRVYGLFLDRYRIKLSRNFSKLSRVTITNFRLLTWMRFMCTCLAPSHRLNNKPTLLFISM
jgi:hypothetical protein